MKRQTKSIIATVLCMILVCSFFSCGERKELQVFFYEGTVLATSEDDVLVVGTADMDKLGIDAIDVLVIQDPAEGLSMIENYDIGTVYIPDTEELSELYGMTDAFVVRVEGSMSFGIGAAAVSVMAGTGSLMTKMTVGEERLLLCGSAGEERISEFLQYETQPYTYINLTEAQKGIETPLLEALKPRTLIFTGTEPYVADYPAASDSIILKE